MIEIPLDSNWFRENETIEDWRMHIKEIAGGINGWQINNVDQYNAARALNIIAWVENNAIHAVLQRRKTREDGWSFYYDFKNEEDAIECVLRFGQIKPYVQD